MSSEALLPPRVVRLGEALRPLLSKVRLRSDARARGEATAPVTAEFLSHRLRELERTIGRLGAVGEAMMAEVIGREDAQDADVYRVVARLESRVEDLIDDSADLRGRVQGEFGEGAHLLGAVYEGLLERIENWLEDLVESVADPLAAAKRKGLETSGYVELHFRLNLDAPQQIAEFQTWVNHEARRRQAGATFSSAEGNVEGAVPVYVGREAAEGIELARLKRIGGGMRRALVSLNNELEASFRPGWSSPNIKTEMPRHLDRLECFDKRLESAGKRWRDAIGEAEVDEAEADKAATRIALLAEQMLAGYRDSMRLKATGRFIRGRDLLVLNYRQTLCRIQEWLRETARVLEDPLAECKRRGLATNGWVHVLPELRPEVPPADSALADWLDDMRSRGEADDAFWSAVLLVGTGALIGGVFFDD